MSRRFVLLLSLMALALLVTAAAPWNLSGSGLGALVGRELKGSYGIDLTVRGRSTFALLPVPRVKFEDVQLASADGALVANGGTLRGELRVLPLLLGRIELREGALSQSRVAVRDPHLGFDPQSWLKALRLTADDKSTIRRLVLASSVVEGPEGALRNVNLVLNWPDRSAAFSLSGAAEWRGEPIAVTLDRVNPALLATGRPGPFEISLSAPSGRAVVAGEAQIGSDPRVTGTSRIEIRSIRDLSRWSGFDLPLGSLMQAFAVEGDFSADRRRVSWPSVVATVGADRLEGTLALRFEGGRPVVTGTLAAESIDLSSFFAPFSQARTASGLWSGEDVSVRAATGGDLDLRLSATDARIGRLKLGEMAASILVRPGRIEASLGRASLNKGILKGRLSIADLGESTDLKMQGAFDRIDVASFLADLGQNRWLTGQAGGQFAFEASGGTVADLVRRSQGRTSLTIRQGELTGMNLTEALKRVEKRPLAASLEWKGGRTAFDQIQLGLQVASGVGEITDGAMAAPGWKTELRGRVSLIDRTLTARALVDPTTPGPLPSPVIVFDLTGGWDEVAVIPDARSLIERSRAAKPLFGAERLAPAEKPAPLATAQ